MSAKAHERFNIETTPYATFAGNGVSDGTTNSQGLDTFRPFSVVNGGGITTTMYCEPEQNISQKNESVIIDGLSRLLIFASRTTGTGTWQGFLGFRRTTGAVNQVQVSFDIPLASAPIPTAIDNPLPANAMKSINGGESLTDILVGRLTVTPGQAVAANIGVFVMLVPGFVDGASNKGANVSAPQYLTYR